MYDIPSLLADPALLAELRDAVQGARAPERLRDAKIKLTPRCNLRCQFCWFWRTEAPGPEMTTDEVRRLLDDLARLDCRKIHFSGGEPALRSDLPALVGHAASAGMKVVVTTNGTLLSEELADALVDAGLHRAVISLDGPSADLHDGIRGVRGTFKRAVAGITQLRRARKRAKAKLRIRLNTVLTRDNYHAYPDLLALAGTLGAEEVIPMPVDEGGKSRHRLLPWQLAEFNERVAPAAVAIRAQYGFSQAPHLCYPFGDDRGDLLAAADAHYARGYYRDHLCYAPWLTTLIAWDGAVYPCCMARGKVPPLGNVRETPFAALFTGPAYTQLREALRTARLALCHRCDNYLAENRLLNSASCAWPE